MHDDFPCLFDLISCGGKADDTMLVLVACRFRIDSIGSEARELVD